MNEELESCIVNHVLKNFGFNNELIPNHLIDNAHLLMPDMKLFEGSNVPCPLWGLSSSFGKITFDIFHGQCWDEDTKSGILLINITELPTYGINFGDTGNYIYCKTDDSAWMQCPTYLQGTFLAGMEQVKEMGVTYGTANLSEFNIQDLKNLVRVVDAREA